MAPDPRTPVLVGAGQVTVGPDDAAPGGPEPLDLMTDALRRAGDDCGPPAGRRLLEGADSLRVVASLGWRPVNAAALVADRLASHPRQLMVSATGGNMPQSLLHDAARSIWRGDLDVVLVTGAECLHSRLASRRAGEPPARWTEDPQGAATPETFGDERAPATPLEERRGITLPIHAYPLLENALGAARGWEPDEHRRRIGTLWASFAKVAAGNPDAWIRSAPDAASIVTPGPANRMVAWPYTKLCASNIRVDQGAAFILCSAEAARRAGVAEDRWVFPWAGAEGHDHWYLSERPELHRSPAIRHAGRRAFALAGAGPDDLAAVDLYSCFPVVVRMAAGELGFDAEDPSRPLTLTGGLTWAGGPGNNYVAHSLAAMVGRLRAEPGALGLVSALGWYATKHSIGIYGSRPPPHGGRQPFRFADVQAEVDAGPRAHYREAAEGPVTVETFTVVHDRQGEPATAIVACRLDDGARVWAGVTDPAEAKALGEMAEGGADLIGHRARLGGGGRLFL